MRATAVRLDVGGALHGLQRTRDVGRRDRIEVADERPVRRGDHRSVAAGGHPLHSPGGTAPEQRREQLGEGLLPLPADDGVDGWLCLENLLGDGRDFRSADHDVGVGQDLPDKTTRIVDRSGVPAGDREADHIGCEPRNTVGDPPGIDRYVQIERHEAGLAGQPRIRLRVRANVAERQRPVAR
jgi:hypothetical protein